MDGWQFASSVISATAWPAAAVTLGLLLRSPVAQVVRALDVKRLKVGPVEIEQWDRQFDRARESVAAAPAAPTPGTPTPEPEESLFALAEASPSAAIIEGFKRIEDRLRYLLAGGRVELPATVGVGELVRGALSDRLITDKTAHAIGGLQVIRDLTVHGAAPSQPDAQRAREFVAMVNALLFSIDHDARSAT